MKTYKNKCVNCGKQEHIISNVSKEHGVKLRCCLCNRESKYWFNLGKLEWREKNEA